MRVMKWRPRRGSELLLPENISVGLYPIYVDPPSSSRCKISVSELPEILERHKTESLRSIAKEYGVSHETVRRALAAAQSS